MKKCSLEECETVMQTRRGMCKRHYNAFMKYGDPRHREQTHRSMSLWEKVLFYGWRENDETGCWDWRGSTRKGGYGRISHEGKGLVVTRVVLEKKLGRNLEPGELALHSCDRPICVNPEHLRPGSVRDNTEDMIQRGRSNFAVGERVGTSKLTSDEVIEIRFRRESGESGVSLAEEFQVSPSLISHIYTKQRWQHLD